MITASRIRPRSVKRRRIEALSSSLSTCPLAFSLRPRPCSLLMWQLVLLLLRLQPSEATLFVGNDTYASLPALFGRPMQEGKLYRAHLQFLPENPYLCDPFDPNTTSFVLPSAARGGSGRHDRRHHHNREGDDGEARNLGRRSGDVVRLGSESSSVVDAVALLAARGSCPFQRKAATAESFGGAVQFLVVYNFNLDGEDTVVPMYSEMGDTRLHLLSITHRAGIALLKHLERQAQEQRERGGPVVALDGNPPEGLLTVQDLQRMLLSALGLFFMLISFSGCMLIVAGTYGHVQGGGGRLTFARGRSGRSVVDDLVGRRRLLTEEQVHELSRQQQRRQAENGGDDEENHHHPHEPEDTSCAVCLEELIESGDDDAAAAAAAALTTLPCGHRFHTDCIVPWLTERQAKCPLCKFDVMEYILDGQRRDGSESAAGESITGGEEEGSSEGSPSTPRPSRSPSGGGGGSSWEWWTQRVPLLRGGSGGGGGGRWTPIGNDRVPAVAAAADRGDGSLGDGDGGGSSSSHDGEMELTEPGSGNRVSGNGNDGLRGTLA